MSAEPQPPASCVVAVLTYRRNDDLEALLPMLVAQAGARPATTVLVVDNDPDGGAAGVVADAGPLVRYVHEPEPGIVAGRNRALDESADARLLVYIDDDERPVEHWLADLIGVWEREAPAAVVGAVVSEFTVEPDAWVRAGDFFRRRRLATGTAIDVAATNNLLLDLDQVHAAGLRFEPAFGITGGSDTLFSRALVRAGGRMLWCDEAVVVDIVPPNRVTREWVLQRAYRSGNSWSRTSLWLADGAGERARTRAVLTARGGLRMAGGLARLAIGTATRSLASQAHGSRTLRRGAGMVRGAWGSVYAEYRR